MEVIIIETQAFYRLLEEVKKTLVEQNNADEYLSQDQVMNLFKISNKNHFSMYQTKHKLPCYKQPGTRHYLYKRSEIENFIKKNRVVR